MVEIDLSLLDMHDVCQVRNRFINDTLAWEFHLLAPVFRRQFLDNRKTGWNCWGHKDGETAMICAEAVKRTRIPKKKGDGAERARVSVTELKNVPRRGL